MKIKQLSSRYQIDQGFDQPQSYSLLQNSQRPLYIKDNQNQNIKHNYNSILSDYSLIKSKQLKNNNKKLHSNSNNNTNSIKNNKQQAKLKFISIQRQNSNSTYNYNYLKAEQQKLIHKSLMLEKNQDNLLNLKKRKRKIKNSNKSSIFQQNNQFKNCLIQTKRNQIGQNLQLKNYTANHVKIIKERLVYQGESIIYERQGQINSHGILKKLLRLKDADNFMRSKYNRSLLQKINESYITPKSNRQNKNINNNNKKALEFQGEFQSNNLDFVTQINSNQFDIYLKADTNTLGHQNWFYFKLLNHTQVKKNVFLNICNLKRSFKLIKKGQKVYRRHKKIKQNHILQTSIYKQKQDQMWSSWQKIQQEVTIGINQDLIHEQTNENRRNRLFKLSFFSTLQPQFQYEFSLIPPYTYSKMLKQVEKIEETSKNATVEILSFSLIGLAIPIVTFTKTKQSLKQKQKKNVILISSRIHPGQTCSSYVVQGILKKLCQDNQQINQFLQKNIVKVIPILNPDGVILGNFRTSNYFILSFIDFLGNDLNRCFHKDSESIFPQIFALKQLGRRLKFQYGQRFLCFLDLHGHSSQKNIFTYGPEYDINHRNYASSRFIPKVLENLSNQFNYNKCTFKLEQCKLNTARGFFLSKLKIMAFTIQSSYSLYDNINEISNQLNIHLKIQNWQSFGINLINCMKIWTKSFLNFNTQLNPQNQGINQKFSTLNQYQLFLINKIKKQLRVQTTGLKKKIKKPVNIENQSQDQEDSDGQSQSQDIPLKQRQKLQKKIFQRNTTTFFPRILRPAIIHPEVTPASIFNINKIGGSPNQKNYSINISITNARMKRKKINNIKLINSNSVYTQYLLKQIKGLQSLRPNVDKMRIVSKQSSIHDLSLLCVNNK